MQPYYWIPLLNALVYTVAALCLKRATTHGVGPWRTTFLSNLAMFLAAFPLWFFGEPIESWKALLLPLVVGGAFFLGQLLTCLAIHRGDVSLLTPLLGTKTVFVAVIVSLGLGESLSVSVWIGAVLSAVAILLMRGGSNADKSKVMLTIVLGVSSALSFAGADSLLAAFGGELGFHKVVAGMFSVVMLCSFGLVPLFKSNFGSVSAATWKWMGAGAALMAVQAGVMAFVLSTYGKATIVNIMYSSRGIWSVALVWWIGHWFSNEERQLGRGVLLRRLLGSVLLLAAILAVVD
ncbi:DMT family transporter [Pelagicoccus sp. SDUM812005]|uniref:DMT family transporter n=1 Tax=Pelagicoccus sp. SDUM812005 TaxID=3041257 RepID=UPI00280C4DD3|nr:DMT family transporter [Pelagicoccus sp. SDUM812005]MDQ8179720.1 DMT family transporter [Pelagicoccus sp. SDUM812005]